MPSQFGVRNSCRSVRDVVREFGRLLWTWWAVDRIRVSPTEGELLRLPINTLLQLEGTWWTVQTRWVCDSAHGSSVRYQCGTDDKIATLDVQPPPPAGSGRIRWTTGKVSRELHPSEIEVYEINR